MATDPVLDAIASLRQDFKDQLAAQSEGLKAQFADINRSIQSLAGRVDTLEGEVRRLRGDMVTKFESIEDKLTKLDGDINTAMHAANAAFERVQTTRRDHDGLADLVLSLSRQVARLRTDLEELRDKRLGS